VFEDLALEMLQTEPELKAKFEAWKAANPALLSNQEAVLGFIFANGKRHAEPEWRRYPVLSSSKKFKVPALQHAHRGDPAVRMQAAHKAIAMHYALNLRTFFYSHYFYLGLRFAAGLVGVTLITLQFADMATAMTVCIGALCTALMDMPSPLRHKFNEMSASVLLCSAVTLLISLCAPYHWLLMTMLVLISFGACMMVVYGRKSMPLQLATLFIMTMSMEHSMTARESFIHTGLFTLGAVAYLAYAMGISWILRHRIKQQVLAEALFELAAYIDIKADFYDTRYNLTEQFNKLIRHQSLLADRQQASRDLILRSHNNAKDAIVVQVHVCMLDLYELILSTHTDYAQLRVHLADSPVLKTLHDLAYKAARDIESVAYDVTRKKASYPEISYDRSWTPSKRNWPQSSSASSKASRSRKRWPCCARSATRSAPSSR
jgi:uncharacterized membrane protein YccC